MASKSDRTGLATVLVVVALSAVAWWFGSGTQPVWWLTWLAPLPVLWLAPKVRAPWAALAAFVAYAAGSCNLWTYLHGYVGFPMPIVLYFIGSSGVMMSACLLLFRRLLLRGRFLAAALSVPAAWVAFEYVNSLLSPHSTFFNISYTQASVLPIIQLVAITGIWGVSFLLLLAPAAASPLIGPYAT